MGKSLGDRFFGIVKLWWRHRISFAISVVVTLIGLAVYYVTFLGEQNLPLSDFVSRLEYNSLDLRFQLRGRWKPDPRIVIVDIDQHSQEVLGHWPFSRHSFAELVDAFTMMAREWPPSISRSAKRTSLRHLCSNCPTSLKNRRKKASR